MPSLPRGGGAQGPRGSAQRGAEGGGGDARGRSAELLRPRGRSCPGMGAAEGAPRSPRGVFGCWASPLSPSGGEDIGEVPGDPQPAPGSRYLPLSPWDPPTFAAPLPALPHENRQPRQLSPGPFKQTNRNPPRREANPTGNFLMTSSFKCLKGKEHPGEVGGGIHLPARLGWGGCRGCRCSVSVCLSVRCAGWVCLREPGGREGTGGVKEAAQLIFPTPGSYCNSPGGKRLNLIS